jgi:U3 small nucleolar RNA-associated protein 20
MTYISTLPYSTPGDSMRYLLVPSIKFDLLDQTWSSFRAVLPTCCSPEVQRVAAKVWESVLRRLKGVVRQRAVVSMAQNLEGVEDASVWMAVFACKVRMLCSPSCLL